MVLRLYQFTSGPAQGTYRVAVIAQTPLGENPTEMLLYEEITADRYQEILNTITAKNLVRGECVKGSTHDTETGQYYEWKEAAIRL